MRRILSILTLTLLLALTLAACGGKQEPAQAPEPTQAAEAQPAEPTQAADSGAAAQEGAPYKIGVVVAATGGAASLGEAEKNSAEMIKSQLEASGVTGPDGVKHPVEVIILDSESNPDTAAAALNRLINEEKVDVVVGGTTSGNSLAMVPIATENETVLISMGAAGVIIRDPETGETRKWIFKTPQENIHSAKWQAEYLKAQGVTKVCYLYENTGYGQDTLKNGEKAFSEAGIEIVYSDAFERSDTEFPQMSAVQGAGCEAVVIGALPPGATNVTAALRDFVPDAAIVHGHGVCNQAFINLDPEAVEGVVLPCGRLLVVDELPDDDPQKPVLEKFAQEYKDFTGSDSVSTFAGHAWDALQWAIIGLESLPDGLDLQARRAGVRDAIETQIRNWPGTGGIYNITPDDHLGLEFTGLTFVKVQDGQFKYYPPEAWGGNIDESMGREGGGQGQPYKIGVVVAATGGASSLGVQERETAEMVAKQLQDAGGITGPDGKVHPVEFVILDSESNPDTAAAAINRLINEEQVDAVLGGTTSGNSLAMVPIATENETVLVSMGSAGVIIVDPQTGETRKWIFKTPHVNSQVAQWHKDYLKALGVTKVCYLYENTGYGQDVLRNGEAVMQEAGIEVVYSDAFERSDTEFPQMTSVQSSGCAAVIIGSPMPGAVNAMAALQDYMPDAPVLHSGGICNEAFLTLDPAVVEGAVATCPKLLVADQLPESDPQYDVIRQFMADYEAYTGKKADSFAGHAWDGLQWILMAMEQLPDGLSLQERRAAIRDNLETYVKDWPGTGGVFTLEPDDHLGVKDYTTALTLVQVQDDKFVFYPQDAWGQ